MSAGLSEIADTAGQQSEGLGTVNIAVDELDRMMRKTRIWCDRGAASAALMRDQARQLAHAVARIRLSKAVA